MKKRFLAIIATLALAVAFAVPTFAAGTITKKEQALLNKFSAGVKTSAGVTIVPPAGYVAQARKVLLNDSFSDAELAKLESTLDSVYGQIKASNATSLSDVKKLDNFDSLVSEVESGVAAVGYKVSFNSASGTATLTNTSGKTITVSPTGTKQTGFDMTATVVSVLALVGVLSAGGVVISKKELLAD